VRSRESRRGERGTVTAELAVGLVGMMVVLAAVLGVAAVGLGQLRVVDAARAGARAAARGDPTGEVLAVAHRLAPGASVTASRSDDLVRVTVTAEVRLLLPGRPDVLVRGSAAVPVEAPPQAGTQAGPGAWGGP
jgi:hypothetical protein